MVTALQNEQQTLLQQMQTLREEGKAKSYHFKEKMGRRLALAQVLDELARFGVTE